MSPTAQVAASIPQEWYVRLKDRAKEQGTTYAEQVRRALEVYLYPSPIGPETKVTVDGQPMNVTYQPSAPTIAYDFPDEPELDPSTGEPIA